MLVWSALDLDDTLVRHGAWQTTPEPRTGAHRQCSVAVVAVSMVSFVALHIVVFRFFQFRFSCATYATHAHRCRRHELQGCELPSIALEFSWTFLYNLECRQRLCCRLPAAIPKATVLDYSQASDQSNLNFCWHRRCQFTRKLMIVSLKQPAGSDTHEAEFLDPIGLGADGA